MDRQNTTYKCTDCNGTGKRLEFAGIFNGVCFTCNGKGILKIDANAARRVIVKQHSRKLRDGASLNFMFWNTGDIQIVKRDEEGEFLGARSATLEEAREIYKQPAQY